MEWFKVEFANKDTKFIQEKLRISCTRKHARNQINPDKVDISKTDEFILHNKISKELGIDYFLSIDAETGNLLLNNEPLKIHCFYWSPMFDDKNITIYVYADTRDEAEAFLVEKFRQTYLDSQLSIINTKGCPVCDNDIKDHYFNTDYKGRPVLTHYGIGAEPCIILTRWSE